MIEPISGIARAAIRASTSIEPVHEYCGYVMAAHVKPCTAHGGPNEPSTRPCMLTRRGYFQCPTENEARMMWGDR